MREGGGGGEGSSQRDAAGERRDRGVHFFPPSSISSVTRCVQSPFIFTQRSTSCTLLIHTHTHTQVLIQESCTDAGGVSVRSAACGTSCCTSCVHAHMPRKNITSKMTNLLIRFRGGAQGVFFSPTLQGETGRGERKSFVPAPLSRQ